MYVEYSVEVDIKTTNLLINEIIFSSIIGDQPIIGNFRCTLENICFHQRLKSWSKIKKGPITKENSKKFSFLWSISSIDHQTSVVILMAEVNYEENA